VILSNKSVEGGVELVAAKDYDERVFAKQETKKPAKSAPSLKRPASLVHQVNGNRKTKEQRTASGAIPAGGKKVQPGRSTGKRASVAQVKPSPEWSQDPVLREMRNEMQALRRMMENELSELTWRDLGKRRPQTQELIRRLMSMGFTAGLCRDLANRVADAKTLEQAWHRSLFHLISELPVRQGDLVDQGGVVALVGPTGVGKTTTIAKLAARFCLRHTNRELALITTDNYRIGAQEQLHDYGRILDVPVRTIGNPAELRAALHALSGKRLILIDTAGMGQQDLQFTERLALLTASNHPIKALLTLNATTQRPAIAHAIRSFGVSKPVGVVLTKMDEAASLGDIFSPLIEAKLPLAYVTDGQRVPEDLHIARAHALIDRAIELAKAADEIPAEDYLAYAYGGMDQHARY
jgi:flagellar biosynthesis protein FlhF